jgi:DNA-directed RNA polymerase specialized sigma24 family protein
MEQTKHLIKLCLQNNRVAQQQLYNQFAPQMLGVCFRYTKSITDAADILQEGFVRVFKNLNQYRFEGELGACIRRVTISVNYFFIQSQAWHYPANQKNN